MTPRARIPRPAEPEPQSFVYFVQASPRGLVKIGRSCNFTWRLRALRSHSGVPVIVLALVPGGADTEQRLHLLLARHRRHGEWFNPAPEVLQAVSAAKHVVAHLHDYDATRAVFYAVLGVALDAQPVDKPCGEPASGPRA